MEIGLKERICQTLGWKGYPNTKKEFENLISFRTHDLEVLLQLSGVEERVTGEHFPHWSVVISWNPEVRYLSRIQTSEKTNIMISATEALLEVL